MRETWLNENQRLVSQDNFGNDIAAVEAATKKHEAIETDIMVSMFVWLKVHSLFCPRNDHAQILCVEFEYKAKHFAEHDDENGKLLNDRALFCALSNSPDYFSRTRPKAWIENLVVIKFRKALIMIRIITNYISYSIQIKFNWTWQYFVLFRHTKNVSKPSFKLQMNYTEKTTMNQTESRRGLYSNNFFSSFLFTVRFNCMQTSCLFLSVVYSWF